MLYRSALAGSLLLLLTACGGDGATSMVDGEDASSEGSDGADTVNVGIVPTVNVAPIILGEEKGFFAEEGIELDVSQADSGGAILTGVIEGSYDFGFVATPPAIVAVSEGAPLRAISGAGIVVEGEGVNGVFVAPDSDIESFADLAGETVAVNSLGALFDVCVRAALAEDGVDPSDVEIIELPFNQVEPSLDQGHIDAGVLIEPFKGSALAEGFTSVGDPCSYGLPVGATSSLYVSSEETLEEQADLAERFTRALEESQEYAGENHDEMREVIPSFTSIEADAAEQMDIEELRAEIDEPTFDELLDIMVEHGFIDDKEGVEGFVAE